jgi:ribonuclease E
MKRILINATQREELRVAIVDGQKLHDLDIELASREQKKGNLYKGRITRVEHSLEACFVEYGAERHGFLPIKEVTRNYFRNNSGNPRDLEEGTEVIVQVEKEERGTKGAALTTYVSLAGRYLVLMPNNPRAGGVSRRAEGDERNEAKQVLDNLQIPDSMGVIIRSNGVGRTLEEIQWDANYLVEIWNAIDKAAQTRKAPFLIYQENNIILRALRDYLRPDIGEVIIDSAEIYEQARQHMEYVMPQHLPRLKLYKDETPLFQRFQVESQIELAHERTVRLPSGGAIVIDHTEALTAIDVNSAKATGGRDIEETALRTNLEAAEEVARQLRLRDAGGLIVVDFIDMESNKNQREVEKALEKACEIDRARIQFGRLSRFGLMEMSRQRLAPSLGEHTQVPCPRCSGRGQIRSVESLSLSILRLIEEEAMKDRTARVIAQVPVDVGTFLLNEKRLAVREIEARNRTHVAIVPNATLHTPNYEIKRVRGDQMQADNNAATSYVLASNFDAQAQEESGAAAPPARVAEPAVKQILPSTPAPIVVVQQTPPAAPVAAPALQPVATESIWSRLMRWLGFGPRATSASPQQQQRTQGGRDGRRDERGRPGEQRRDGRDRGQQRHDGRRDQGRQQGQNRGQQQNQPRQQAGQQQRGQQQNSQRRPFDKSPDRDGQTPQGQRGPQQQPRPDARPQQGEAQAAAAGSQPQERPDRAEGGGGERGGGGRGRRGGRGRGPRGEGGDRAVQSTQVTQPPTSARPDEGTEPPRPIGAPPTREQLIAAGIIKAAPGTLASPAAEPTPVPAFVAADPPASAESPTPTPAEESAPVETMAVDETPREYAEPVQAGATEPETPVPATAVASAVAPELEPKPEPEPLPDRPVEVPASTTAATVRPVEPATGAEPPAPPAVEIPEAATEQQPAGTPEIPFRATAPASDYVKLFESALAQQQKPGSEEQPREETPRD